MKTVGKILGIASLVLAAGAFVSCNAKKGAKDGAAQGDGAKKRIINIASSNGPNPWIVVDDNGKSGGYDIDIIRLVFEQLPQYEARFTVTEFASIFTGLDSGLYQLGVNHLGYNRARGEKYLFSYPYDYGGHGILVRKDSDIKTVFDLGGHSTIASPASFNADTYENWNAAHPEKPIDIIYTEEAEYALQVSTRQIDFYYFTKFALDEKLKSSGLDDLVVLNVPLEEDNRFTDRQEFPQGCYYVFPKGEEKLQEEFDAVLLRLVEDGTVQKLRKQYFNIPESEDSVTVEFLRDAKVKISADQAAGAAQ